MQNIPGHKRVGGPSGLNPYAKKSPARQTPTQYLAKLKKSVGNNQQKLTAILNKGGAVFSYGAKFTLKSAAWDNKKIHFEIVMRDRRFDRLLSVSLTPKQIKEALKS